MKKLILYFAQGSPSDMGAEISKQYEYLQTKNRSLLNTIGAIDGNLIHKLEVLYSKVLLGISREHAAYVNAAIQKIIGIYVEGRATTMEEITNQHEMISFWLGIMEGLQLAKIMRGTKWNTKGKFLVDEKTMLHRDDWCIGRKAHVAEGCIYGTEDQEMLIHKHISANEEYTIDWFGTDPTDGTNRVFFKEVPGVGFCLDWNFFLVQS